MGAKTEKYTDRDLMLKMVDAQEALLLHFSNGKFVESLKLGIREQTRSILIETNAMRQDVREVRGVTHKIFRVMIPIIVGLVGLLTKIIFFSGS